MKRKDNGLKEPIFKAIIKGTSNEVTGYYCPWHFQDTEGPVPAIHQIENNIIITSQIELSTLEKA